MGKILLFGSNKGGGGKTTILVNVAIALINRGFKIVVVNADRQGTFHNWQGYRKEEEVEPYLFSVNKYGKIANELLEFQKNYDYVLVDVAGYNSPELIQSLGVADICIAPHQATQPDLETMTEMQNQLERIIPSNPKLKVLAFQNQANTNKKAFKVEREIFLSFVEGFEDIQPTQSISFARVCYYNDWPSGYSVFESGKNNKGIHEINQLTDEILTCLNESR